MAAQHPFFQLPAFSHPARPSVAERATGGAPTLSEPPVTLLGPDGSSGGASSGAAASPGPPPSAVVFVIFVSVAILTAQLLGRRLRLRPQVVRTPLLAFPLERPG